MLHLLGNPQRLAVPGGDFAEMATAVGFAPLPFAEAMQVQFHHVDTLKVARTWRRFAGLDPALQLLENPRIGQCSPANGDAVTTRFLDHLGGIVDGADVAVAEDGNRFDRFNRGANPLPIDVATESLFTGSAMNRDRGDADFFKFAGKIGSAEVVRIPAEPHFHGDGERHRVDNRFNHADRGPGGVAHHR